MSENEKPCHPHEYLCRSGKYGQCQADWGGLPLSVVHWAATWVISRHRRKQALSLQYLVLCFFTSSRQVLQIWGGKAWSEVPPIGGQNLWRLRQPAESPGEDAGCT